MLILGIDPGTATTGYGIINANNNVLDVIEWGLIETEKNGEPGKRLNHIHLAMVGLLKKFEPEVVAIERLFFATNAKTAMAVGQATGVLIFTAARHKKEVVEYAPMTIKKMVAGDGRADKKLVQKAVRDYLGAKVRSQKNGKTHFDNAADALAVALCHAFKMKEGDLNGRQKK